MTQSILVLHEKHGDRYFGPYEDIREREALCRKIIYQRIEDAFWYADANEYAKKALAMSKDDPLKTHAFRFLESRSDYEYEDISIHRLEN